MTGEITYKELEEWREKKFKKVEEQGITKETDLSDIRKLSARSFNALKNSGANTIGDALAISPDQLLKQKNFGESSLVELEDLLGPFGWPVREPQNPKDKRMVITQGEFEHAIKTAIEEEREACALICDGHEKDHRSAPEDSPVQYAASEAATLASAIRARSQL